MSNSAIVLLCIEILILIFFMGITHNSEFRKKLLNLKFKINSKFKLNLKTEEPSVKRIAYKILFSVIAITFFLTDQMVVIILLTAIGCLIPKTVIKYERYKEIFMYRNPSLKKYNFYLLFLVLIEITIILMGIFFIK